MMRPEWAEWGTVTRRPRPLERSRAAGPTRLIRAPGWVGKTTIMPACRPLPFSSRVPPSETVWGLLEQWLAGTQPTLEIRTGAGCEGAVPGLLGATGWLAPPTGVPPGLAPSAAVGTAISAIDAAVAAARERVRL